MVAPKKRKRKIGSKKESFEDRLVMGGENIRKKFTNDDVVDGNRPESVDRMASEIKPRGTQLSRGAKSRDGKRPGSMMKRMMFQGEDTADKAQWQEKLQEVWNKHNIPEFHREVFSKCENVTNPKQTIEIIKNEIVDLEANRAAIQNGLKAVLARENCLKQLRELVDKLVSEPNSDPEAQKGMIEKSSEYLTHLRILSLNVVECILRWREYIQQAYYITRSIVKTNQTIMIPFMYEEVNYLIKMKNDTRDLVNTPLSAFFNFSSKSDPFLVYPSKEINDGGKTILYISKNLINRIRASELVILEEGVQEHMAEKQTQNSQPPTSGHSIDNSHRTDGKPPVKIRQTGLYKSPNKPSDQKLRPPLYQGNRAQNSASTSSHNNQGDAQNKDSALRRKLGLNNAREYSTTNEHHEESKTNIDQTPKSEKTHLPIDKSPEKSVVTLTEQAQNDTSTVKSPEKQNKTPERTETPQLKQNTSQPGSTTNTSSSGIIRTIDIYEDEIADHLAKYVEAIDFHMKNSFITEPKDLLSRANNGQDPLWFELFDAAGAKNIGLAVTNVDNTHFLSRRLVILHFSVLNRNLYAEYLKKFVEYLWKNQECDEIKISLYHIEGEGDNNTMGADKQLQDNIKSLGFRWKQLINDKVTGKRYIDYMLKRPEQAVCEIQKVDDEPIHISSLVVLSDLKEEVPVVKEIKSIFDNRYCIVNAVLKHCDEKLNKLDDPQTKRSKNFVQVIGTSAQGGLPKIGNKTGKFENYKELEKFFNENMKEKNDYLTRLDEKSHTNIFTASIINLVYRWKSCNVTRHKIGGNEYKYLRLNNHSDLVKFHSSYNDSSVYFIPTDDAELNVFVTDNETLINKIIKQEEIIEDVITKLFASLDRNPTTFEQDLWLPFFSIKGNNLNLEEAKHILKNEYKINYAFQSLKMQLNGTNLIGNLKVRPNENSCIIEKPFLVGVIHEKIDFPLFAALVKSDEFLTL